MRNTCYKIEKKMRFSRRGREIYFEQHIHRDAISHPVKKYFRYLLKSIQITFEVDKKTHKDIEYKREFHWNIQWMQMKWDLEWLIRQPLQQFAYPIAVILLSVFGIYPEKI